MAAMRRVGRTDRSCWHASRRPRCVRLRPRHRRRRPIRRIRHSAGVELRVRLRRRHARLPTAQCGTVSVPVDYAKPEGAQAQLAVIRVPATGDRIGVLMVNPGGPGASAVDTVAGMGAGAGRHRRSRSASTWSASTRAASGTPRRKCGAAPTPNSTPTVANRWPTTAPPASPTSRDLHRKLAAQCLDRMGADFLANVGTASTARDMDVVRAALGREPDQLPRLLLRHRDRGGLRRELPRPGPGHGPRRRGRPEPGSDRPRTCSQMAGFQTAFDDYAADCAQSPDCPLGTDPAQFVDRYHQLVDPLVTRPAGRRPARSRATRTRSPAPSTRSTRGATGSTSPAVCSGCSAAPTPATCCCSPTTTSSAAPGRALPEPPGRVQRDPVRRLRTYPDRPGGVGRRRPAGPPGRAVPVLRGRSPAMPPVTSAPMWPVPPTSTMRPAVVTRTGQGRRRVHDATIRPRRTRPVSTWPARWTPR